MKFTKVLGKIDENMVRQAEEKLSKVFLELATKYDNTYVGSNLGGDPLIFGLIYPIEHVCTFSIPTAATDGKRFFWNPPFVIKQSIVGLRIIASHEAWHAIYLHPQRRGSRIPHLWNIAVDYVVNSNCMEDLRARKQDPADMFNKHMGQFCTLAQFAEKLKDPWNNIKGFGELDSSSEEKIKLPAPNEDRELTEKELKELERREKVVKYYYADPNLEEDMKNPEAIYSFLYGLLPKCPKCGRVGMYKRPPKDKNDNDKNGKGNNKSSDQKDGDGDKKGKGKSKKSKGKDKSQQQGDNNSGGCGCGDQDCSCGGNCPGGCGGNNEKDPGYCDECGGGVDIFSFSGGGLMDTHIDTSESEEKLAKRMSDAMEAARKMAGTVPEALEDELGKLTAPKITWQDVIRTRILKVRMGKGRNDWTRFRSRPMFVGLLIPKKKHYFSDFVCLLDTSGSMSCEDMSYGVSQLQSLDEKSEGTIVCADAEIYWSDALKITKCNVEQLSKLEPVGRGGTMYSSFFTDYEKELGKKDFAIVITDGYLLDSDVAEMKDPGIPVFWIITSSNVGFKAPFGKVYYLYND